MWNDKIVHLPKETWKGQTLPIGYTTEEYYDVNVEATPSGFGISIEKKRFDSPVTHSPEEYDFPDKLYEDYWEDACAWGIVENGSLIAAIETCPEKWSNRLRVTELWVADGYHRQGIGHALMEMAREQARLERRRAVMLETQSCNANAIGFYLHEGFTLIGLDTCCYANNDPERKEVRLEMGWFPKKGKRLTRGEIEIRPEEPEDYRAVEEMVRRAFWNKHHMGCDEHYLVSRLRDDESYLPELSRIAVIDGQIAGCILYSRSHIQAGDKRHEIVTFGPLCVDPEWHGCGIGEMLLKETMPLAAAAGYPGIVIFGEPDYYPRFGFQTCEHFNITTKEGKNFNSFLGIELIPGAMKEIRGSFFEADVFEALTKEDTERFDQSFPPLKKQYFPQQWD